MKFYLSGFFAIIFSGALSAQTKSCTVFKNGKFKMTYKGMTIFIDRINDKQSELYPEKNITLNFRVKWIDACHYTLTPLDISKYPGARKDAMIYVAIDSTTSNSYFQTATSNFSKMKIKGEIVKVGLLPK